jgi:hypothetical protein
MQSLMAYRQNIRTGDKELPAPSQSGREAKQSLVELVVNSRRGPCEDVVVDSRGQKKS